MIKFLIGFFNKRKGLHDIKNHCLNNKNITTSLRQKSIIDYEKEKFLTNIEVEQLQLEYIHNCYIIKQLQLQQKNKEPLRVLFFSSAQQIWANQFIYDAFMQNPNFNPIIVAFPNIGYADVIDPIKTCQNNYNFFKNRNMNVIYGYDIHNKQFVNLQELKADIIFYDQPYPFLPKELLFNEVSKNALICYVPYSVFINNEYVDEYYNMDLHNKAWKIFGHTKYDQNMYQNINKVKGKNVEVHGHPKLDVYNQINNTTNNINWKLGKNSKKRIIWAPHWSIDNKYKYSTFANNYKKFLEYAKQHIDIDWIFKPHPGLYKQCIATGLMSEIDIDKYFAAWDNLPNATLYNDGNYFDIFKTSDALITDCLAFLIEYIPTQNPILHLVNDNNYINKYNDNFKAIIENHYRAKSFNEVEKFINHIVLNNNDIRKDKRLQLFVELNILNKAGAAKSIVNSIEKQLFLV